ncbi:hypothetical protein A9Q99_15320 [Gammaproteobacteria bacterium 45_16_T64]|nr:hypothetical protein A9Q99_15320 [Gammaproteobacteria bacterium 45_16_T64]
MEAKNSLESIALLLQSLSLMELLYGFFSLLIVVQLVGVFYCARVIVQQDVTKDIRRFLNEYWRWKQVRQNSLLLSLWLSSLVAYVTVWFVTVKLADIRIQQAAIESPLLLSYIACGCLCLLLYTLSKVREQIDATRDTVKRLKQMRLYTAFKSVLQKVQGSSINNSSWGIWVGTTAAATEWLSERWVKRKIDAEMKDAILNFSAFATVEYLFRMSLVGVAIWIIYR